MYPGQWRDVYEERKWSMVEANRDKPTVIALREMALGKYGVEVLNRGQA